MSSGGQFVVSPNSSWRIRSSCASPRTGASASAPVGRTARRPRARSSARCATSASNFVYGREFLGDGGPRRPARSRWLDRRRECAGARDDAVQSRASASSTRSARRCSRSRAGPIARSCCPSSASASPRAHLARVRPAITGSRSSGAPLGRVHAAVDPSRGGASMTKPLTLTRATTCAPSSPISRCPARSRRSTTSSPASTAAPCTARRARAAARRADRAAQQPAACRPRCARRACRP